MNILVISFDYFPNPGGIAIFMHNICAQLSNLGHRVDIIAKKSGDTNSFDRKQIYNIYRCPIYKHLSSLVPILKTMMLHVKNHYDIIILGHFMTTHAIGAILISELQGIPYVVLSHGNDLDYQISNWIDEIVANIVIKNSSQFLCNSYYVKEKILKKGYRGGVNIFHPGVDTEKFNPNIDKDEIQIRYANKENKIIFTAARLVSYKNIENILRSLVFVIKKIPNITYIIAGEGEQRYNLGNISRDIGIDKYVKFIGYVENDKLPAIYCASDIYVMPSIIETFGISFIEANACGKPVIGGQIGGVEDAIVNGETGLLVNPNNIEEIAEAIIKILSDNNLSEKLGKNGRKRAEKEFDWKIKGKEIETLLQNILLTHV
jgi:phosphatidyl-myo-inositol dimannoside synthase